MFATKYRACRDVSQTLRRPDVVELATAFLLLLALVLSSLPALASSGITPPVAFQDLEDPWELELQVLRDDVLALAVSRDVLRAGARVSTKTIPAHYVAGVTRFVEIPLFFDGIALLPDGAYSQNIRVVAELSGGSPKPYADHKTVHFLVEGGRARRIDVREYSQIADPTLIELDGHGREIRVHPGAVVAAAEHGTLPAAERSPGFDKRLTANRPTPSADAETVESEEDEE